MILCLSSCLSCIKLTKETRQRVCLRTSSLLFGTAKTFALPANFEYKDTQSPKIELYPWGYPNCVAQILYIVISPIASFVHGHIDVTQNRLWMLWDVLQSVIAHALPLVSFDRGKSLYAARTRLFRLTCINTQNPMMLDTVASNDWRNALLL